MNKKKLISICVLLLLILGIGFFIQNPKEIKKIAKTTQTSMENDGGPNISPHPLSIQALKDSDHPGSDIVIEQELDNGSNYKRYIASYKSDGLKLYALLTVPIDTKPKTGWPVIIFNHGYIPPKEYRTTERYIAYTDAFSRNGYIVFRSDYRGHGNSQGEASSYGSNGYSIDILNAIASMKKYPDADKNRIGMWGHSMGGYITLRNMVVSKDIKAGVIWAGVVASYPDLLSRWRRGNQNPSITPAAFPTTSARGGWRTGFISQYGTPEQNPDFWNSISANSYLSDIKAPIQLHHGTADTSVPFEFSETLEKQLKSAGKEAELYLYENDDHDITINFTTAMNRSVAFFDKYVKGTETSQTTM